MSADAVDLPFYNGRPTRVTGGQWWVINAAVVVAFAILLTYPFGSLGTWGGWVPVILFPLIPLLTLRYFAPQHWTALFRRVTVRSVLWMFAIFVLNYAVTLGVGAVVFNVFDGVANEAAARTADLDTMTLVLQYLQAVPQLLGEELLTMLPLLALMYWFFSKLHLSRRTSMVLAWILTSLLFGAYHLPTYDWNVVQAVFGIGIARLVLTLGYLITKNLWVSTGAHILNDWAIFTVGLGMSPFLVA